MKRILIIAMFFWGISSAMAQEVALLNYNSLERKFEKSTERVQSERRKDHARTWLKRGELLQNIYKIDLEYLQEGTSENEIKIYYKEPENVTEKEINGKTYKVLEYERIDYYLDGNRLSSWKKKKTVTENPLMKAYEAYMNTLKFDDRGRFDDDVKEQLEELKTQFKQQGINAYYLGNKEKALHDFEMVNKINDHKFFEGVVDTIMVQYSGIISRELGNYQKAADYYMQLADMDFGGPNIYLNIKNDYLAMKDSAKAMEVMEKGFEEYPDTLNIVANLVDLYIKTGKLDQGIETIEKAISNNPDKGALYYWKGRLLLNDEEDEERIQGAIDAYSKAIELNPTLYYVYYDLGFIYFLQGQEIFNQAGLEKDVEVRKEINKVATEKYKEAIPLLNKSLELNDANIQIKRETLDVLKRIYYKLGNDEKYNEVTKKLNNL